MHLLNADSRCAGGRALKKCASWTEWTDRDELIETKPPPPLLFFFFFFFFF
ncbi:hypothetical protein PgNI_06429 [Pyricularia grisea]|uniref:Uncharacterized protein n=1 Tax=Pyricularia grisea TaxID=148305 RepID=A0A6P8B4M3_PYRGI